MKKFFVLACAGIMMFTLTGLADAGSLSGKISYKGKARAPKKIKITKDPNVCGTKGELIVEKLLVNGGGLANVILQMGEGDVTAGTIEVTQENCRFDKHVTIIPSGSKVKLNNKDGILHNFHSFPDENEAQNFAQPGTQKSKTLSEDAFEVSEIFPVKCDVHEWMNGIFAVVETPHAAISGKDGSFKIANIPDGSYTLKIWHEAIGEKEQDVTIKGDTKLNIALSK